MKYTFYSNKSKDISNFLTEKFFFSRENGEEVAAIINYLWKYSRVTNMPCTKASSCFWTPKDYCSFDFAPLISGFQLIIPLLPWQLVDTSHRPPPPRPDPPETRLSAKNVTEMGVIRAADLCLCLLNRTSTRFCVFWHVHGGQKRGKGNKLKAIRNVWLEPTKMKMFLIIISPRCLFTVHQFTCTANSGSFLW